MELSAQEKLRMSRLSQDDQLKLKAIMQMMAKEKDDIEKDARKAKGMMEQEPKQLNTVENLIINHLKSIYSNAYSDNFYQSFTDQLMDNAKKGLVNLDGLDVQDEFDNFVSVNRDNVDEVISLKEILN
jgi:hypothetical protein|tara:strand:- start:3095 stop:3478 length:384 start_codon:yes stop_codon:yes gene_type:complete